MSHFGLRFNGILGKQTYNRGRKNVMTLIVDRETI